MPAQCSFDYAVWQVVPRVERSERLNVGVVLLCRELGFLAARARLDEARLRALTTRADVARLHEALVVMERIAAGDPGAGPIAALEAPARFHWLVAPSSTTIQSSPVHCGLTAEPAATLDRLFDRLVLADE